MKRVLKIASVLLPLAVLLTGCKMEQQTESNTKEPVKITFWHYYNDVQKNGLDEIIAEYNDTEGREKNITVEAVGLGAIDDIVTKVASVLKNQDSGLKKPNMFLAYRDTLQEIQKQSPDALLNYYDYFTKEELDSYYPDFLEEGRFGDALYIMPVAKSTELLFMNETSLDAFFSENPQYSAKSLETWESLAAMAEAFYDWTDARTPDVLNDGRALIGLDNFTNYFIAQHHALGAPIYVTGKDGRVSFTLKEDNIKKLFENYYIPYTKGYYGGSEKYCSDDVRQDHLQGYIGSVSSVSYFPETVYDKNDSETAIEMGIYPYPYFEEAKKTAVSQGAGIVALKGSEQENEAVADFIQWISKEKGLAYAAMLSYMPTDKESVESGAWDAIEDRHVRKAVETGIRQVMDYHMVRGFDFEGAYDVRMKLEDYFKSYLQAGREEYLGYLHDGMQPQEAAEAMDYGKKADAFYRGILAVFQ